MPSEACESRTFEEAQARAFFSNFSKMRFIEWPKKISWYSLNNNFVYKL